jgi:hypothetical protein
MRELNKRFVRSEFGIAAALMLIGVGAWVIATAPGFAASTQPLGIMANTNDLPTSP